jgi:hypothetical protein
MYKISIDSGKDNFVNFEQGDLVKAQKFTGNDIRLTILEVVKVESDAFYGTLIDGVAPVEGMNFIRIDNTQDDDRAGMVIISATGSNTPFIDITFKQETKSRLGRLDGISDVNFPTLEGYGLYSDNVYLKGELVLNSGENVQSEFESQNILIQANSNSILLKADQTSLDTTNGNVTTNSAAIGVNAGEIVLRATQIDLDNTNGNVANNASAISINSDNINLRVEKDDVINQINISTEGILIAADNIEISGATTFTSGYDPSTKETPTGAQDKADTAESNAAITSQSQVDTLGNSLGDVAYLNLIEEAQLGTTVIVGGFLKTDLIDVDTLIVQNLKTSVSGQRIEITSSSNSMKFINSSNNTVVTIDDDLGGFGVGGILINDGVINSSGGNNNAAGIFESGVATLGTTQTIRAKVGVGTLIPSQNCAIYAGDGEDSGDSRAIVCDGDIEIKEDLIFKGAVYENTKNISQSTAYTIAEDEYMIIQSSTGDVNLPSSGLSIGRKVVVARRSNTVTVNGNGKSIINNGAFVTSVDIGNSTNVQAITFVYNDTFWVISSTGKSV